MRARLSSALREGPAGSRGCGKNTTVAFQLDFRYILLENFLEKITVGYKLSTHRLATEKPGRGRTKRTAEQREEDLRRHQESVERMNLANIITAEEVALHKLKSSWLYQIKHRALKTGLDFDLDVESLELPVECPILGLKLQFNVGGADDNSYSMDRRDNTKGYTKDNIQIISLKANRLKSNATLEELIKIGEWAAKQKATKKGALDK
jgi:hypothetical protein